jgi:tetratricopeptide (TPR) repeat protein
LLLLIAIKRKVLDRSTNRFMLAGALAGTTVLVLQAGMNFIFHQAGLAILGGVLLGALFAQDRDDAAALVTKSTLAWRSLGILVLVGTASFACVAYLAGVPAELIKNPLSSDGLVFSKLMTQENLETLSKLDPMSPIPDFAIAHRYTIAGILTDNKTTQRQAFDQALDYYKKAAKRAPFEPSIPYREAMVYSDYRDMDESARNGRAISALEESLKLNPNYTVALTTYVQMQIKAGHLDEAVKKIKEAQERAPAYEADSLSNLEKLVAFAQKHSLLSSEQ